MTVPVHPSVNSSTGQQRAFMAAPAIIDQVLRVLSIFLEPSGQGNKEVDLWLNSFQKTPAAWSIADQLLRTETLPVGVRLFAAQTIRQKVEYDLKHLDAAAQATLRDSLIDLLHQYKNDVKPIVRQICLSLADLAIQMHEWDDPVRELITKFGQDPAMVAPLLEFLLVLPEEFSNRRIQIDDDEAHGRAQHILRGTANEVLALLLYYHTHAGDNDTIQRHILDCLHSWIHSSDLEIEVLPSTPVIGLAFDALDNDNLSDVATDLICEITRRTGSVKKSGRMEVIHAIYPGLRPLRAKLNEVKDDPEAVRDLCRIFTTAGEAWADLIGTNYDAFNHVIEGLLQCAGYPDLDIAKITFMFWERLKDAVVLQVNAASKPNFIPVYTQLIDIIIHHLQYPKDLADWTAEERDEFRDFRHVMGDVLKDCVQVLGAEEALSRPYSMLCSLCTAGSDGVFDASVEWQRIEAPLFSFRAMCREVTTEVTVIPKIMEMLPQLPEHPKIKYAAILVIGRYAEWTAKHPEFISYQLNFVSQGFEDKEAVAAAAQSLKYLCRECGPHLVNHLEQLHHFYFSTIKNMGRDDAHDVTQAIAHIIAAVPLPQLAVALQKFCHPMAQRLHEITAKGKSSTEEEEVATVKEITSILNQLSTILKHGTPKPDDIDTQQHPSIAVISEIWPVLDMLITQYASVSLIDEAFARFCAYAMAAYKWHLLPVLSPIMTKVVALFNQTGEACYLWASWRCVREYGSDDKDEGKVVFGIVENLTTATFQLISNNVGKLDNIPDGKWPL
ncbi:armadillo-type protein [Powellomyces hirtus]|nr:armadillo-type protein [Powellomyces hirtus]